MKTILFALVFGASLASQAAGPEFGAFVTDNVLYVTFLGDNCNSYNASLQVEGLCHKGRMTMNYASQCGADLMVGSTKMACHSMEVEPHTFAIKLSETDVAPEAKVLFLKFNGKKTKVKINK
jgi:hypothetical protein